jgi:3-oxoacyl-[acyl-carrier-protein] synthase III
VSSRRPDTPGVRYAQITGWGMAVPEKVLTNADLARVVETTDEWIVSHTGIRQRHVAGEKESTSTLAVRAARDALLVADIAPAQIGLVIVATITPDYPFPATANLVQDALGASNAAAFDLAAGCSGFIYALSIAADIIRAGSAQHVLVIGAETLSRAVDWTDRNTCVLFGDGAGAVVVSACAERCGVLASILGSDGSGAELLFVPGGGGRLPATHETIANGSHFVKMNGREVFRFATTIMPRAAQQVLAKAGWQISDLALIIPHQANARIIDSAMKRLGLTSDQCFINIDRYGNTSAASIPIALCEAIAAGRVKAGDKLVLVGFGTGLTWAAAALEWGLPIPLRPRPWHRRSWTGFLFWWAGVRSLFLRSERHAYNWVMGPVGKDDWRGKLRKRVDRFRFYVKNKLK